MSIFLMGTYNPDTDKWCTVTKCSSGFDDAFLEKINKNLDVIKISKKQDKVPDWLNCKKTMVPDFVVADPKKAPIWEVSGAEFSKAEVRISRGRLGCYLCG